MNSRVLLRCLVAPVLFVCAGCGEDTGGIQFATASGVVTLKGNPLSGAQVMAFPEKGPVAVGNTDDLGKFTLYSGTRTGVAVGSIRVSVSTSEGDSASTEVLTAAGSDPASVANMSKSMEKLVDSQKQSAAKKRPPEKKASDFSKKYGDAATSGLRYEIKPGPNNLTIDLK